MMNAITARITLLLPLLFAGCVGHQGASALIPQALRSDGVTNPSIPVHRMSPTTVPGFARFTVHHGTGCSNIISDGSGNLWYTKCFTYSVHTSRAIKFNESTHVASEYVLPGYYHYPETIALGRNNNGVWFTDGSTLHIGYLRFSDHKLKSFRFTKHSPYGITAGPDNAMWFTEQPIPGSSAKAGIGRIDLSGFSFKEYVLGSDDEPSAITLGRDGALWFIDGESVIGRITPTGAVTRYLLSDTYVLESMTTGPDGAMWFTGYTHNQPHSGESTGSFVGRMDLYTHKRSLFRYGKGDPGNGDIAARDSELWMTKLNNAEIDSFDVSSHTVRKTQSPYYISDVARGLDDELWLNDGSGPHVVKMCPDKSSHDCAHSP
jgi:streptogramin lyase